MTCSKNCMLNDLGVEDGPSEANSELERNSSNIIIHSASANQNSKAPHPPASRPDAAGGMPGQKRTIKSNVGGNRDEHIGSAKRPRQQLMSCPYRKRNSLRFNIRDHTRCAIDSFTDLSGVKRHVRIHHRYNRPGSFVCPRCQKDLASREGLLSHLSVGPQHICEHKLPSPCDVEDGITSEVENVLQARKSASKVDNWIALCRLLFPSDEVVPSSGKLHVVIVRRPLFNSECRVCPTCWGGRSGGTPSIGPCPIGAGDPGSDTT
ncbi:hypothetical protein QBC33DRAFT_2728 [Phialemonium atrogriseum]|uniref:C2H2-type domain-containing protein n=1 Tax=Phialemonium atrogriseum TaxID=1093897 RepID=A0AAJ0C939_9PEZI|nr:uncharacterized protein QBC33DRAFT_2728 [Phialemonium atrogriseum]KAK1772246.1 hypothetical protein QBC33DRAFT_2728 [Phialemonium atrogriseum]